MGYGIICTLDDQAVRATPTGDRVALVEAGLTTLFDVAAYPSAGVNAARCGPWRRLAGRHSSDSALWAVHGDGSADLDVDGEAHSDDWVAAIRAGDHTAALRSLRSGSFDPRRTASDRHATTATVYGPDRVAGATWCSVWWLHADALNYPIDTTSIARGVVAALDDRFFTALDIGPMHAAFNRAGMLVGPGPVAVAWSGNRLCAVDDLLEPERQRLGAPVVATRH